jgi:hypothetical protein
MRTLLAAIALAAFTFVTVAPSKPAQATNCTTTCTGSGNFRTCTTNCY